MVRPSAPRRLVAVAADLIEEWGWTDSPFVSGDAIMRRSRSSKLALQVSCSS